MQAAGVIPPVVTPAMHTYSLIRYCLVFVSFAYTLTALWFFLEDGRAARWRDSVQRFAPNRFMAFVYFYLFFAMILTAIRFPLSFYSGYILDHQFGLSNQTMGTWFFDLVKAKVVEIAIAGPSLFLAFTILEKFPRRWPLVLWACLTPLIAAGIFLTPLVIDPLYNKFTPMPDSALRTQIRDLTHKAGIPDAPIFVVDKSRQTSKLNAYVTGIGSSARVVIWDTTLHKLPPEQVLAIVGHETGHYVLGHIYWGFLLSSGGLLLALLLLGKYKDLLVARFPSRWQITSATDLAIIPVLMLGATIVSFVGSPIDNSISRVMEHQADVYGLQITGNGPAMARTFVSLSEQNLSEPDPPAFIQFWFFGHPSLKERIDYSLGLLRSNS